MRRSNEIAEHVIEPGRNGSFVDPAELWRARELLYLLVWRDLKVRYKQTLLGVAWIVLQAVLATAVFTLFFGGVARPASSSLPYPVFALAGVVPWLLFAYGVTGGTVSLDDCSIYVSAEPCAYCCYAIRESRIGRVVYALSSPHMGGVLKWPVLTDQDISDTMPDVFADPPAITSGLMAQEAEEALLKWNPVIAGTIKARGLFVVRPLMEVRPTRTSVPLRRPIAS